MVRSARVIGRYLICKPLGFDGLTVSQKEIFEIADDGMQYFRSELNKREHCIYGCRRGEKAEVRGPSRIVARLQSKFKLRKFDASSK